VHVAASEHETCRTCERAARGFAAAGHCTLQEPATAASCIAHPTARRPPTFWIRLDP
jgi:hypothetical protein